MTTVKADKLWKACEKAREAWVRAYFRGDIEKEQTKAYKAFRRAYRKAVAEEE